MIVLYHDVKSISIKNKSQYPGICVATPCGLHLCRGLTAPRLKGN